jgi:O-antigen/teichoic acid export membrane protein
MSYEQSSYRKIMKATTLFGGVQVFNVLISIIRSKFIAVLLGTTGMGITGLLTSTTGLISALTNFGLATSAVKNVAAAYGTGNRTRIAIIITVLRRWVWVTGLLGMIVTIVIAPLLSRLTFGNNEYSFPFIWISVSLLMVQLSNGQMILLQGMRKLKYLAKANLSGSILGLIITVPLYYLFGIKGIVPAIIVTSLITLACSWYFTRKIEIEKVIVSNSRTFAEGKEMLTMGFMISLSSLITIGASYIVRIFISNYGGVDQVGLYNAGFAIINSYVGLIFTAMGTDYYPRLSAVAHSNDECRRMINQQAEIAILIMAPIIILFFVFIHWIVIILYSTKFASVNQMILWAALGMLFKAMSWAIAFIFLAKGASRLFFWNELIANVYMLALNMIGYYYYGLTGLGFSFLIGYFIYLIQVFIVAGSKFEFKMHYEMYMIFFVQFTLSLLSFLPAILIGGKLSYIIGSMLFLISLSYSYKELDKRMGIRIIITDMFGKYKK